MEHYIALCLLLEKLTKRSRLWPLEAAAGMVAFLWRLPELLNVLRCWHGC